MELQSGIIGISAKILSAQLHDKNFEQMYPTDEDSFFVVHT